MSESSSIPVATIDGPSGSGKGTISRAVARTAGWHLLDSGALYRLVALAGARQGLELEDRARPAGAPVAPGISSPPSTAAASSGIRPPQAVQKRTPGRTAARQVGQRLSTSSAAMACKSSGVDWTTVRCGSAGAAERGGASAAPAPTGNAGSSAAAACNSW